MNDISIILDGIRLDAKNEIDCIKAESDSEIDQIKQEYDGKFALLEKEHEKELSLTEKRLRSLGVSGSESAYRRRILEIKSNAVEKKIKEFSEYVLSLGDEEYFSMLASLCDALAEKKNSTVFLSEKDSARNRDIFLKKLELISSENRKFTLSDKPTNEIQSGCIVSYGQIAENLSWESLIENKKDDLRDALASEIYGEIK